MDSGPHLPSYLLLLLTGEEGPFVRLSEEVRDSEGLQKGEVLVTRSEPGTAQEPPQPL